MTKVIEIGSRRVGPGEPCFILAEIGLNHNGDLNMAKELIRAALSAGADAVKFQKRKLCEVYQEDLLENPRNGEQGLQYVLPLLVEFELSDEQFVELHDYCAQLGIMFLCTPWDEASTDFLDRIGVPAFKIGSPDMTNFPLLERTAATGKPLIVSTGMSTEEEVRRTINFLNSTGAACALLHAVSAYPPSPEDINLRFMQTLRDWSGWPVGYSGHENGTAVSVAAVALGASIIERHITLDMKMRGPDHSSSLEPHAFAEQVRLIRETESALGSVHRWPSRGELLNRRVLGKSLVATSDIPTGTTIQRNLIAAKSPGLGLSPQLIDQLVGQVARRFIRRDEQFVLSDALPDAVDPLKRRIELGGPWGVIARFKDLHRILGRFQDQPPDLVEFHVSDRDLDSGEPCIGSGVRHQDLAVHAPEYCYETLIDLCCADDEIRCRSIQRIQLTLDLARRLAPSFAGVGPGGPKVIVHVGGMWPNATPYDLTAAYARLDDSLRRLESAGAELLFENLPPLPWYFGGRWFGHVFVDSQSIAEFCARSGVKACLDTSHAMLACNKNKTSMQSFVREVLPFVRHLHVSDATGVSGEGVQIGEGQINFTEIFPLLSSIEATMVPEVWHGHLEDGLGFQIGLERLTDIAWTARALARTNSPVARPILHDLVVRDGDTILEALKIIDRNGLGVAFVLDDDGAMCGLVTDGDIRRCLMRGAALARPVSEAMNRDFVFAWSDTSLESVRSQLSERLRVIPVLDRSRRLTDFAAAVSV